MYPSASDKQPVGAQVLPHLSLLLQSSLLPSSGAVAFAFEELVMLSLVELNSLHPKVLSSTASPWEQ